MNTQGTNHYLLLGFEPALELDEIELKQRFTHLRTQFHPDRFGQGSALERRLAVQRAADINAAYATLSNPIKRAQHYFELLGITFNEAQTLQDEAFLMQQMELREALDDAQDTQTREELRTKVRALWSNVWYELSNTDRSDAHKVQRNVQRLQFLQRFMQQMDHAQEFNS